MRLLCALLDGPVVSITPRRNLHRVLSMRETPKRNSKLSPALLGVRQNIVPSLPSIPFPAEYASTEPRLGPLPEFWNSSEQHSKELTTNAELWGNMQTNKPKCIRCVHALLKYSPPHDALHVYQMTVSQHKESTHTIQ